MIDIKSAWSKWSQDKADSERQKYYYAFLKCELEWLEEVKFNYFILTKQKKVQLQWFEYTITKEEARNILKSDLKHYITNEYVHKPIW